MLNDDGSSPLELTSLSFQDNHAKRIALWKIIYYKNTGWLTFHSSHCFTDGGSVLAYLKDFVEGLNQSQESIAREV
ncbi:hypothetical protein METBIDRAFT_32562 [Metschnikowia bicuspidata var. bicuspidata NRRL YB-4993]|uniref:CoA-dependent acyltransferase n=1 Tax=Metschnikowia bicuspidata var. bicuspidata NRRL YB-4993 TaxID=869754 RepID=A0A1A0H9B2_9ASCO|nr:hypothetical protein METBIDRAFT_32562 [Metschnikowia bicuspidata var. bicuspidata NRRL YB-4993]OBA20585.1 hypothetical protein METBIDRAFT_32562 [Metschnikowia bicuspidata var. bicuspidata NRRL YB-4993]